MPFAKNLKPSFHEAFLNKSGESWIGVDNWLQDTNNLMRKGYPIGDVENIEATIGIGVPTDFKDVHVRLQSATSGNTTITADPQIKEGVDGQVISLEGNDSVKTVTLQNGNGLKLNGATSFVLGKNDIITLYFNKPDSLWVEKYRSKNS